ncbi:hypothetical protein FCK90_08405 [Kocuria coralli]|uniref:YdbS-like PH domain-containing protein n=1 Tax=Kocuria coralli TaxID=1461025 RepID=A0A5J5KWS1_9MICC|nr:PH domain-containing protein [Kocuria coralli]KAA9394133.1 hypothetical protein FCK90_08405 [Kocuria coralli]
MSAQDRTSLDAERADLQGPGPEDRTAPPEVEDEGSWHRMHPLSPLARGWIAMVVVIGAWMNTVVNGLVGDFTGDDGEPDPSSDPPAILDFFLGLPEWVFYGSMAAIGAIIAALGALYVWWFTRYQVTETHVRLRTGLVFRQERQTRLDRVQALDIHRPLVPRILGLAELRFEVADAGETSVTLRYLKHDHARRLRKELLGAIGPGGKGGARAGAKGAVASGTPSPGTDQEAGSTAEENEEELLLSLPLRRVVLARLLTVSFIVLTVLAVAAVVLSFVFPEVILPMLLGFIPTVLALGGTLLKALEISWSFKMYRTPEGLRLRYGLINKTSQTVPTGRIQALAVYRPLLWRKAGWSLVHVNVAGYGGEAGGDSAGNRSVLLPVATDGDLNVLFREGLRIPHSDDLTGLVLEGLMGEGDDASRFVSSPERVKWVAPIVRRRYGYAVTDRMLLARGGRAYRQCCVIPHNKLQSIGVSRGPVARRLDLADVSLHSIVGAVRPTIYRMDFADAQAFVARQLERGRSAPVVEALTESPASPSDGPASPAGDLPALPWDRPRAEHPARTEQSLPGPAEASHRPAPAYGAPGVPPGLRRPGASS